MIPETNSGMCVFSHSVMSDSLRPHGLYSQAPPSMQILQARILEWVTMPSSRGSSQPRDQTQVSHIAGGFLTILATREISIYNYISESEVAQSCPTLCDPMDSSLHQGPPSMGFSRQEDWGGLPFPSPGNLPNPGIEPRSLTL